MTILSFLKGNNNIGMCYNKVIANDSSFRNNNFLNKRIFEEGEIREKGTNMYF